MRRERNVWARVLLGLAALGGAVILLWSNEGRVNWREVAATAVPVSAEATAPDGAFVAVTGTLLVQPPVDDPTYLRPGNYAFVARRAEMYAWVGDEEEGYRTEWTDELPDTADAGTNAPQNPPFPPLAVEFGPETLQVGNFTLDPGTVQLPAATPLSLSVENVVEGPYTVTDEYIFQGEGSVADPDVGDIRLFFEVVPAGQTVTAFGTAVGARLESYSHRGRDNIYRIVAGDRPAALVRLETEFRNLLWGFRGFGFCLTWLGLWLVLAPLTTLLSYVPILGRAGSRVLALFLLPVAFILAATVALISAIFHNVWALLALALLIVGGVVLWQRRQAAAKA